MLKEEIPKAAIKVSVDKVIMLGSFVTLCFFIYTFHVIQSAIFYRTYFTALCLLIIGICSKQSKEPHTKLLWEASFIWFVYSFIFFDIRTHVRSYFYVHTSLYIMFPLLSFKKMYSSRYGTLLRVWMALYVCFTPTVISNVYGNALYSIVKLLCLVLLVSTESTEVQPIETYIWPLFAHPLVLLAVPFQVIYNLKKLLKHKPAHKSPIRETSKIGPNDVIGARDVPFLFSSRV